LVQFRCLIDPLHVTYTSQRGPCARKKIVRVAYGRGEASSLRNSAATSLHVIQSEIRTIANELTRNTMIDLYFWPTRNGKKITILLEEAGIRYNITSINIGRGDQLTLDFLRISPNGRMPAIVDHEPTGGGSPITYL
jgi:hypothetical protein